MKKILKGLAICLLTLFFVYETGFAATLTTTPDPYKITMKKVRLQNAVTDEWVTVGEGDLTIDIASVNAGELAAGYVTGNEVPEGSYDNIEVTLSTSVIIKASCTDTGGVFAGGAAGDVWYTTSTAGVSGSVAASKTVGSYSEGTATIPSTVAGVSGDTYTKTYALPTTIVVAKGSTQKVRVKFEVANSATFQDTGLGTAVAYPSEPTVEMQIIN